MTRLIWAHGILLVLFWYDVFICLWFVIRIPLLAGCWFFKYPTVLLLFESFCWLVCETDNCPSWINRRERMTVKNILWSISTKECCRPGGGRTRNLLPTSRMRIQLSHRGQLLLAGDGFFEYHTELYRLAFLYSNSFLTGVGYSSLHWLLHYSCSKA